MSNLRYTCAHIEKPRSECEVTPDIRKQFENLDEAFKEHFGKRSCTDVNEDNLTHLFRALSAPTSMDYRLEPGTKYWDPDKWHGAPGNDYQLMSSIERKCGSAVRKHPYINRPNPELCRVIELKALTS